MVAAVGVPPSRIKEDILQNNSRNLRFYLQNLRDNILSLEKRVTKLSTPSTTVTSTVQQVLTGDTSMQPYDIVVFFPEKPKDAELMLRFAITRAITLPVELTGSKASSRIAAAAATTLTIKKNGVSIGTINWALGATTATFSSTNGATFATNDILTVENQATADADLEDISITLSGTR